MLKKACWFCKIVGAIAIIGALNWGLVGLADYNLVEHLLGVGTAATRVVYGLVGLSGLALLASYFMACPNCNCCNRDYPEDRRK
ncbi:MAG: DUF378 domain-containing protein [Parachlamydiaceae bacterium]|nr:DUF378 domain-containing protein [Parachlamydiaceae bacterium]